MADLLFFWSESQPWNSPDTVRAIPTFTQMDKMLMKDATSGAIFPQYEAAKLMLRAFAPNVLC